MSINNFEIKLLKYLQENSPVSFSRLQEIFFKSHSSLKRDINTLNLYLSEDKKIIISGDFISTRIEYHDFLFFLKNLSLKNYIPTQKERVNLLLISGIFNPLLNKSRLYSDINISLTTLKKDTRYLQEYLKQFSLKMLSSPKKGIIFIGNEFNFRILATSILSNLVELDSNGNIIPKLSNSPLENFIVEDALNHLNHFSSKGNIILTQILESFNSKLSYASKKFLILYTAISFFRIDFNFILDNNNFFHFETLELKPFNNLYEDFYFNNLFVSLDFSYKNFYIHNKQIEDFSNEIISFVDKDNLNSIFEKKNLLFEVSEFLLKNILRQHLNYTLYDDNLRNTEENLENLFTLCKKSLLPIEQKFNIKFTPHQCAILTIIFEKYFTKNMTIGQNRKSIVIISNSSSDKLDFFIESLKSFIEIDIILCASIDELEKLNGLDFYCALVFSNRIKFLLEEKNIKTIKLSFHLDYFQIEKLLQNGFSRTRKKFLSKEIAQEVFNKSKEEIETILKNKFPEHFI